MPIPIDRGPRLVAVAAAVFLILGGASGYPQSSATENAAIRQSQSAADDYAFLHRRLQRGLGPPEVTTSFETVRIGMDDREAPLEVNGSLPRTGAKPVLPCVLEVLPRPAPELEYQIIGSDLVLIDEHVGVIVDILPLPAS